MIDYPYNFSDPSSNWTTNLNTNRNVLLEDYTGHYCTGCPTAAAEAKLIEDANNGNIFYNDYSYQLTDPSIDSTFDINNLSLITYVCNRDTYEVIQVIKTELSP